MKALIILALLAVCNANILWSEPPKTNLEVVKDAFWDYVAKATHTAEESLSQIRQSQLGQDVNARITQSADTVNQYITTLRTQVAPVTQNFMTQFTQEAEQLKVRLETDLSAMGTNAEQMMAKIQMKVEDLKKGAEPYAEAMDPEAMKTVLQQKSQELREQLEQSMSQLQAQMVPYTEEMKQKMEQSLDEFQKNMMPLAQSFEAQVAQKTQEIQQRLTPFGDELKEKLDASTQDLQTQLNKLWDSFTKMTQ